MKIAYFDCFSGISGDMTIGALLDAGLDLRQLKRALARLKVPGYDIKKSPALRSSISGTKFDVIENARAARHMHRKLSDVMRIIDKSTLGKSVKDTAKSIFETIGSAEGKVHGIARKSGVVLHELGEIDSIVDIVGTAIALDELGIDAVHSSAVTLGRTMVRTHHGLLPIPGPASMEILKGVPVRYSDIEAELVTPTGAAIIKTLSRSFGAMPDMRIAAVGYGAGTNDFRDAPNMLRVVIGESCKSLGRDRVVAVETNIDDMNPQFFERVFERLFEAGALDVYIENIIMKKSRPAYKLTAIAAPSGLEKVSSVIFEETTSIGVRYREMDRLKLERKIIRVKTKYGDVRVKLSGGTVSPEYDDCLRISRGKKIPVKVVYDETKRCVSR